MTLSDITYRIRTEITYAITRAAILAALVGVAWSVTLAFFISRPVIEFSRALVQYLPGYHAIIRIALASGAPGTSPAGITAGILTFLPLSLLFFVSSLSRAARASGSAEVQAAPAAASTPAASRGGGERGGVRIGPKLIIPSAVETRHVIALGATGAGKTQPLRAYALEARRRNAPAVIPVCEQSLFRSLYDPERDTILCPFDSRSVDWSPLREIEIETDCAFLSESFIARGDSPSSEEWRKYGRDLLTGFFRHAWRKNWSLAQMLSLFEYSNDDLFAVVSGTAGSTMTREGAERMLSGALATASSAADALRAIPHDAAMKLTANSGWSVTGWTTEQVRKTDAGEPCGFLWILLPDRVEAAMSSVAASATSIAIRTLLSQSEREARRFYVIVDELGNLPRLGGIEKALTRGRKYGLRFSGSVQTVAQLRGKYGRDGSAELLACLSSQMIFRAADQESADYASRLLGQIHVTRQTQSSSHSPAVGVGGVESNSTSTSEHHSIESAILDSQVAALPDLRAYVRLAGQGNKILERWISYVDLPAAQHEFFVPRPELRLSNSAPTAAAQAEPAVPAVADPAPQPQPKPGVVGDDPFAAAAPANDDRGNDGDNLFD